MSPGSNAGPEPRARALALAIAAALLACDASPRALDAVSDGASSADVPLRTLGEPAVRVDGNQNNLVHVRWLGISPSGTVAVLQPQAFHVLFLRADGSGRASFGAQGDGPGEFNDLNDAGWIGDTLWVADRRSGRLTMVTADGALVGTRSFAGAAARPEQLAEFPASYAPLGLRAVAVYADGSVLVEANDLTGKVEDSVILIASGGQIERRILWQPLDHENIVSFTFSDGRGRGSVIVPFYARPLTVVSGDGERLATVVADAEGYRAAVTDREGRELWSRRFTPSPRYVTEAELDSAMTLLAGLQSFVRAGAPAEVLERARALARKVHPPVIDAFFGTDHRLWLALAPEPEGRPWLVLSPSGEPVDRLRVPTHVQLGAADANTAWGVEVDAFDVETVVAYRLVPADAMGRPE